VTVDRSFDGGATWRIVEAFEGSVEREVSLHEAGVLWSISVASVSGTADVRLSL
jgi:hypothetical protein